jgi:hypothetical protein
MNKNSLKGQKRGLRCTLLARKPGQKEAGVGPPRSRLEEGETLLGKRGWGNAAEETRLVNDDG